MGILDFLFKKDKKNPIEIIVKTEIGMIANEKERLFPAPIIKTEINKNWSLTLAFGKSTSQSYQKAVNLAKTIKTYNEFYDENDNVTHIVTFNASKGEFLKFIILFDIVEAWKSCTFAINDEIIDRKTIGKIKYCYGDKCRSVKTDFCYGASFATENPFGCHRIQVNAMNNPLYNYYRQINKNKFVLDVDSLVERIRLTNDTFKYCPDFDLNEILKNANRLPQQLNSKEIQNMKFTMMGITLK